MADFLKSLLEGTATKPQKLIAARGLVPLRPRDTLHVLVTLVKDDDPEISSEATKTLDGLPAEEVLDQLHAKECDAGILEHFAATASSEAILEAIVLNASTPGPAVAGMALGCDGNLLETILLNRVRILECPEILENAKQNPSITNEARRLIQEIELEFFSSKKKDYSITEGEESAEVAQASEEPINLQVDLVPDDLSLEGLPLDPEAREGAIFERLSKMTVPQKIHYALMGTKEVRTILIRDPNKQVCKTVLHSPKITESEVEGFAAMRNVSDEVLRDIGNSKNWTKSYLVVHNLVKNPKTPPSISQRLLFRIQTKDLSLISKDRTVSDAVRQNAQRMLRQRTAGKAQQQ
jgi:hypothetical protein